MTKAKEITPKEFNKLCWEDKLGYDPVYKKYKKIRQRDYCEECGHFTGYDYKKIGIGQPIKYIAVSAMTVIMRRAFVPKMTNAVLEGNVFFKSKVL